MTWQAKSTVAYRVRGVVARRDSLQRSFSGFHIFPKPKVLDTEVGF